MALVAATCWVLSVSVSAATVNSVSLGLLGTGATVEESAVQAVRQYLFQNNNGSLDRLSRVKVKCRSKANCQVRAGVHTDQ